MNIQEFQILTLLHSFIIGFCLSTIQSFPWSIFLIPLRTCGIRVYQLTRRAECERIQRRTNGTSSLTTDQNRGAGYSVSLWQGSWYICYIDPTREEHAGLDPNVLQICLGRAMKRTKSDARGDGRPHHRRITSSRPNTHLYEKRGPTPNVVQFQGAQAL